LPLASNTLLRYGVLEEIDTSKAIDKEEAEATGITSEQLNSQIRILKALEGFGGVASLKTYYDLPTLFCLVLEL
jgi:hypothetical protein